MPLYLAIPTERFDVRLQPDPDGTVRTFTVGETFQPDGIEVFHNGRRLRQTSGSFPQDGDFYVYESGGVGTGYDTIQLLCFTPITNSQLRANYLPQ